MRIWLDMSLSSSLMSTIINNSTTNICKHLECSQTWHIFSFLIFFLFSIVRNVENKKTLFYRTSNGNVHCNCIWYEMRICDEGYSRNVASTLNLISTFLLSLSNLYFFLYLFFILPDQSPCELLQSLGICHPSIVFL